MGNWGGLRMGRRGWVKNEGKEDRLRVGKRGQFKGGEKGWVKDGKLGE